MDADQRAALAASITARVVAGRSSAPHHLSTDCDYVRRAATACDDQLLMIFENTLESSYGFRRVREYCFALRRVNHPDPAGMLTVAKLDVHQTVSETAKDITPFPYGVIKILDLILISPQRDADLIKRLVTERGVFEIDEMRTMLETLRDGSDALMDGAI